MTMTSQLRTLSSSALLLILLIVLQLIPCSPYHLFLPSFVSVSPKRCLRPANHYHIKNRPAPGQRYSPAHQVHVAGSSPSSSNGNHKAQANADAILASIPKVTAAQIGDQAYELVAGLAEQVVTLQANNNETQRNLPITAALMKIQRNMDVLENVAGRTPQLTRVELAILATTVLVSAASPLFLSIKLSVVMIFATVVEVLVPSMAAVAASIGLSAEYVGKVAVSKSKEISALAIQAAAEAEALLATAERSKAILPLCVGIATTASAFALLAPSLLHSLEESVAIPFAAEVLLLCPLIAVLAAAVAGLATQEAREISARAAGLGNRRFASSKSVGRTWLSAAEQVDLSAERLNSKWKSFAIGVIPAPVIAAICPGSFSFKTIVCAAVAAAQAAYYLAIAEYFLASAVEAVALKARSSAVADTYANQSGRNGAILPFTSALAGLCAAASAAAVELLPLIHPVELQSLISVIFPSGAALFAAAASVAKARCEVDGVAASEAASKGLSPDGDKERDPLKAVLEQIEITMSVTWLRVVTRCKQLSNAVRRGDFWKVIKKWLKRIFQQWWKPKHPGNKDFQINTANFYSNL